MIHFRQRIPDFMDIGPGEEADCETLAEVLELAAPKRFSSAPGFLGWSLSHRPYSEHNRSLAGRVEGGPHFYEDWLLMADYDDPKKGRTWWVIGYLTGMTVEQAADLPAWKEPT